MAVPTQLTPFIVSLTGNATSVTGDTVRVTVYSSDGTTARGTATGVLDSSKELELDLANSGIEVTKGDIIVATEIGSALGGVSATITSGGASLSLTPTAVAFPSRTL